jgi:hypothetical protein
MRPRLAPPAMTGRAERVRPSTDEPPVAAAAPAARP